MLHEKKSVFIVPCFTSAPGTTADEIPDNKADLQKQLGPNKKFSVFDSKTHDAFDIDYWFSQEDIYTMTVNREFEPYYIGHRNYPLFDEIFYGCGFDKIPHLFELRSLGYTIRVLPRGIIVHLESEVLGSKSWCSGWRKVPRRYIKRGMFFHRVNHTPGIFYNTHDVPWYKNFYDETDVKKTQMVFDDTFATGEQLYKNFIADKQKIKSLQKHLSYVYFAFFTTVTGLLLLLMWKRKPAVHIPIVVNKTI